MFEKIPAGLMMHRRGGASVVIEGHADFFKALLDHSMIAIDHLLGGNALGAGAQHDRHPVLVGAADVDYIALFQPAIAGKDIAGQVSPGQVPQVDRPVGIGKGAGNHISFLISHWRKPHFKVELVISIKSAQFTKN